MRCPVPNDPQPPSGKKRVPREVKEAARNAVNRVNDVALAPITKITEGRADEGQIFMLFASFGGDIFKTGRACGVAPETVAELAEENHWLDRIRELIEVRKGDKGGDIERNVSRAMNFVQANRYRLFLERVIRKLDRMPDTDLWDQLTVYKYDRHGNLVSKALSLKLFADIATALEKVHWMTYQSLLDTQQDRAGRREKNKDDDTTEEDIHARIARTFAGMVDNSPAEQLKIAQVTQVADIIKDIKPPVNPQQLTQDTVVSATGNPK